MRRRPVNRLCERLRQKSCKGRRHSERRRDMAKAVTQKDIATAMDVHVSTVSRALDPKLHVSLTPELVARIRDTAEKMGYRPNRLAASLRTKRTMTVGLMLPDITNTIFPPIVRGVESILEPLGYAPMIVNTDSDPNRESTLIDVLLERGVDGIIDAAVRRRDPRIVELAQQGIPVVTANRAVDAPGIPSVVNDDAGGIALMLKYLFDRGHRRIAHVAGPETLSTGRMRRTAFDATAAELGLEIPPEGLAAAKRFEEEEGHRCAEGLIAGGWPFTAILCANDRLALGVLTALSEHGLRCPEDVSVTGFNDIPFLDRIPPGLTTMRIQQFDVGRLSAEILVKLMSDPSAAIPLTTILPVTLVERGSVTPPPNSVLT